MHSSHDSQAAEQKPASAEAFNNGEAESRKSIGIGVLIVIGIIFVILLATGAVPNPFTHLLGGVSVDDARSALQAKITSESGGKIQLLNFTKMNGQKGQVAGVAVYKMNFRAELQFATDGLWISGESFGPYTMSFKFSPGKIGSGTTAQFAGMIVGAKEVHSFPTKTIEGEMLGEKSENGWKYSLGACRIVE
jgi:hypothetical protein